MDQIEPIMDGSSGTSSYVDSSVGTLVWVRRRNGSWWPGRILGPEELPGSHLLSPRSGTPVKLLGREDASVDWYNIEKSKRVKAFRCGEFDDCIERARSVASLLTKKREKYARREDAILHALELERKLAENRHMLGNLSVDRNSDEPSDFADDVILSDDAERLHHQEGFGGDFIEPRSPADVAHSVLSVPKGSQGSLGGVFVSQRNKQFLDSEWEDDVMEAIPRMRGLQDFGLRIASSKGRRPNWTSACEGISKVSLTEDGNKIASCITKNVSTCSALNNSKASCSAAAALKRKRSQAGPSTDESAYKRRDRRRPLTQVLESSAKLADGSFMDFDIGSRDLVPPFIPSTENGYIIMHPNEERKSVMLEVPFQGSADLESPSGREGFELLQASQIGCKSRQETHDSSLIMDKACSSFSKHVKANCCDGRQSLYLGPHMEVAPLAGSAFVDSLLQGGPASTCTFLSGSAHTGSATSVNDSGLDKSSFLSISENIPNSSSFQGWPNYVARDTVPDKLVKDFSLPGRGANRISYIPGCLSNPLENSIPSSALAFYSSYNKGLEDHRPTLGRSMDDVGSSLLLSGSEINADLIKSTKKPLRQGIFEEKRVRVTEEDEAESFQAMPASSLSSREAVGFHGAGHSKLDSCMEGKSNGTEVHVNIGLEFDSPSIHYQGGPQKLVWGHRATQVRSRYEGLDETGFCNFLNRGNPPSEGVSMVAGQAVSKWQAKGRRNARIVGRSYHRRCPVHIEDEFEQGQDDSGVPLNNYKAYNRHVKGPKPTYKLDMVQEPVRGQLLGGEPGTVWEPVQPVQKVSVRGCFDTGSMRSVRGYFDNGNMRSLEESWRSFNAESLRCQPRDTIEVQDSTWTDVPIEVHQSTSQGEHVPLLSLMSKLNGKAIVGHPVLVEKLERRYGDGRSGARRKNASGSRVKKLPFQPVWRTARRTAMQRVPRSCSSVMPHDCEDASDSVEKHKGQQISRLAYSGHFIQKSKIMRKSNPLIHSPSLEKKLSKKLSKKLGSSQKTRMLSSIGSEHTVRAENMDSVAPKRPELPLVTCVPLSVVFSRIRQVLYKQPSHLVSQCEGLSLDAVDKREPA